MVKTKLLIFLSIIILSYIIYRIIKHFSPPPSPPTPTPPPPTPTPPTPPTPSPPTPSPPSQGNFNWFNSISDPSQLNLESRLQYNKTKGGEYSYYPPTPLSSDMLTNNLPKSYSLSVLTDYCRPLSTGCRARAELEAPTSANTLSSDDIEKYKFTGTFKITNFTYHPEIIGNNSIVLFQIFSSNGRFCEIYWSTDSPATIDSPGIFLDWNKHSTTVIQSSPKLALNKEFTIKVYFVNHIFHLDIVMGKETQSLQKTLMLDDSLKYYFKSGLYLQQDGNKIPNTMATIEILNQNLII